MLGQAFSIKTKLERKPPKDCGRNISGKPTNHLYAFLLMSRYLKMNFSNLFVLAP